MCQFNKYIHFNIKNGAKHYREDKSEHQELLALCCIYSLLCALILIIHFYLSTTLGGKVPRYHYRVFWTQKKKQDQMPLLPWSRSAS